MAVANGHRGGPVDLAQFMQSAEARRAPKLTDSRLRRVKRVRIAFAWLVSMLVLDGSKAPKITGLPEGAELVGMVPYTAPLPTGGVEVGIELMFHHADFPYVIDGVAPLVIPLKVEWIDVNPPAHDVEEGC